MKATFTFLFLILFLLNHSFSQNFGNEWINFSQNYIKIKVAEEALFKITYDDVIAKNFQEGVIEPNKFQIFNKGIQIPIYITGTNDGVFNQGDVIYFYGHKNNASLDKVLYNNQNDLPNNEVSIYTDDNFYFLSYSTNQNNSRYQVSNEANNGLIAESFIIAKDRLNFSSSYYPGEFILEGISLSEFVEGEGYLGNSFSKGQNFSFNLNTNEFLNGTSYQSKLSFYVAGRSNAFSSNSSGQNHHLRVSHNSTIILDSLYRGYKTIRKTTPFQINSANTVVNIASIDDLGALTDFQAPAYLEVIFARNLNLLGIKSLSFNLNDNKIKSLLTFSNSSISNGVLLEKNGNGLYLPDNSTTNLQFIINNSNITKNYYLTSLNDAKSALLENIKFKNFNAATSKSYLMITHPSLITSAVNYQQYNQSIGIQTSLVNTEDLYNEFYYGFHHPMALRNYCHFMIQNGNTKPEYLLLLGRGFEMVKQNMLADLVPTFGFPASDNMITAGLNGSNLEPGLATGRIPAKTNEDIENYLNKLKTYNGLNVGIWRKSLLQATGGKTVFEVNSFGSYQNSFYDKSKNEYLGVSRSRVFKNVTTPITENLTERIINETKEGLALVSYFGHGSATGTEISFGKVTDHQNKTKPTIFLVNGCSTGACFSNARSLGEEYILGKDFGAVGWIGTTSEGVASYLGNASSNYHENWFNKFYGLSIATGIKEGLKTFQNANDKLNLAHTRQYIFLGDPTLKFYSPNKPDYVLENSSLYLRVNNQNATSASLQLNLKVENIGKAKLDSLSIKVERSLPDNSVVSIPIYKIKPVLNTDTILINLSNLGLNVAGNNKVTVKIDADGVLDELNELNNQTVLDIFLPGNGVNNLFPINNGIFSKNTLILKAQPDDLFTKNADYLFEIDTVADFNSNFKKSSPIVRANIFPEWNPNINLEHEKVYFCRARLNLPLNQGGNWTNSSFTFLNNVLDGFSQSKIAQLNNVKLTNIELNLQGEKFDFKKTFYPTSIYTEGDDGVSPNEKRFRTTQSISFSDFSFKGITLLAMSNLMPGKYFSYPSPYNSTNGPVLVKGYTGQYFWDINDPVQVDSLIRFINQIPKDYNVIGFNGRNAALNNLPIAAKRAFQSFGLSKFELINNGEPYMFWGIKGTNTGTALEFTADYSSVIPPRKQTLQYFNDLKFPLNNGAIETEIIGPAKEWKNVTVQYIKNNNDQIKVDVIGVNKNGQETVLMNNLSDEKFSISNIIAAQYPYLKLKSSFLDEIDYTLPKLKNWQVEYIPFAEVSINPENLFNFHAERIEEGDSLKFSVSLTNIYDYTTDSIKAFIEINRPNRQIEKRNFKFPPLAPKQNINVILSESTRNFVGKNNLKLQIDASLNDLYTFNNTIYKDFEVIRDHKQSLVNVQFDGKSIISGEIVSPKPLISITNIDDNKFLLLNDTTTLNVYLKKSSETVFKRISYAGNLLNFNPATSSEKNTSLVEFRPSTLPDGIHSLKISAKDASGNKNQNDFTVDFEVINESSISNFYPYPNPVVNAMKFVFTLTGLKVPDKIKIMIYNSTGKILRVISKEELGNIKIGNNISDFTWDGTDEFGDRLANGVYFYKVEMSDNDDIKHRKTTGDNLFKNNMGKIYLLK